MVKGNNAVKLVGIEITCKTSKSALEQWYEFVVIELDLWVIQLAHFNIIHESESISFSFTPNLFD